MSDDKQRCKVCGGFYGDYGACTTPGCPGDPVTSLWVQLDGLEISLSNEVEILMTAEEIGDPELLELLAKFRTAQDKLIDAVHDMEAWCKEHSKE